MYDVRRFIRSNVGWGFLFLHLKMCWLDIHYVIKYRSAVICNPNDDLGGILVFSRFNKNSPMVKIHKIVSPGVLQFSIPRPIR